MLPTVCVSWETCVSRLADLRAAVGNNRKASERAGFLALTGITALITSYHPYFSLLTLIFSTVCVSSDTCVSRLADLRAAVGNNRKASERAGFLALTGITALITSNNPNVTYCLCFLGNLC